MNSSPDQSYAAPPSGMRRCLLFMAEVLLVLIILALLAATWLPTFFGGHPGSLRS